MATKTFLSQPPKLTQQVDFATAIRGYALHAFSTSNDSESHPDALAADAKKLQELRKEATFSPSEGSTGPGADSLGRMLLYHAQLVYILTKLPSDLSLSFPWYPLFSSPPSAQSASSAADAHLPGALGGTLPIELSDVRYERCNVLLNIAGLYSHLGCSEDRSQTEGMKRAISHFQACAGVLSYLRDNVLPELVRSLPPNDPNPPTPDLSPATLSALISLALAQAHECIFQKALQDHLKNGSIARIAAGTAGLYEDALMEMRESRGAGGVWPTWTFGNDWLSHATYKRWHFAAVAQYRKSLDDLAANRYGDELGRLRLASKYVRTGLETSKKGVNPQLVVDLKSLQAKLTDSLTRAERDNDLIYLQAVTSESSLPAIASPPMVRATVPQEIEFPLPRLHASGGGLGMRPLFERLLPYAVQLAIEVYEDRKESFVREEVQTKKEDLDQEATETLQSLNLPGSLQALEVPLGLPPSLLRKAEELRREGGTKRLRTLMQDSLSVASTNKKVLDDVSDLLDQEESEDGQCRRHFGEERWSRPSSAELNEQLRGKIGRFSDTLEKAGESDKLVREKFAEWEGTLLLLEGPKDALEASVPSTSRRQASYDEVTSPSSQTSLVRELRHMLEDLEDLTAARRRTLEDARHALQSDDIRPQILQEASSLQSKSSDKLDPGQFEPLFQKQLDAYSFYRDTLAGNERKQNDLLGKIAKRNEQFLASRKNDPVLKEREEALQRLDVAQAKFQELVLNLGEALQFYQDFAKLLDQLRVTVREWVQARRAEGQALLTQLNMEAMSMQSADSQPPPPSPSPPSERRPAAASPPTPATRPVNQPGTPRQLRAQQPGQWKPGQPIKFG